MVRQHQEMTSEHAEVASEEQMSEWTLLRIEKGTQILSLNSEQYTMKLIG